MSISSTDLHLGFDAFVRHWERVNGTGNWDSVKVLQTFGTTLFMRICKRVHLTSVEPATTGHRSGDGDRDEDEDEVEIDDEAMRTRTTPEAQVSYDIVHSAAYHVPVLYVTCRHPQFMRQPSVETIRELLVPGTRNMQLTAVGVMGALTMTENPATGLPAFFVHPCQTASAMDAVLAGRAASPMQYLMLWFGLIGASVGLDVPVTLAKAIHDENLGSEAH